MDLGLAVGLAVGGWFASKVIGELISFDYSYVEDQYKWQTGMKEERKRLEKALPKIQDVVAAVEKGHINDTTAGLKVWLLQLKDAAEEADDVLDELKYLQLEKQDKAGENNNVRDAASLAGKIVERVFKQDPTLERLEKAVKKLDEAVADVGVFFALVAHSAAKPQQQGQQSEIKNSRQTSSSLKSQVFGRKNESDEIVKKLLITNPGSTETDVLVISGMGGVGKTTLAQYVLDDESVQKHFDLKIWICVSDIFDVTMLTRKILEAVTGEAPTVTTFDMLQNKLREALLTPTPTPTATEQTTTPPTLKRFLLVLDDVWNDKDWASWENLLAPLRNVNNESKIVVTTRLAAVANVIKGATETCHLKCLSDGHCSSVLMENAFGGKNPNDYPGLRLIGDKIAKKLKGSPLAAKMMGGLLKSKLNDRHWNRILNSDIINLEQSEGDIMPVLRLSYDHLPAHLKSCFAYCSIFPQDHKFRENDLVDMWVAAGLIQHAPDENETPEDVGTRYFEDLHERYFFDDHKFWKSDLVHMLVAAGLIQHAPDENETPDDVGTRYVEDLRERYFFDGRYVQYTMHDLLHDLARLVSAGVCFRLPLGAAESKYIPTSVRHLSVTINCNNPSVLDDVCKSTNLRTLHLSLFGAGTDQIGPALEKLFKKLRSLRVLKLQTQHNIEFPIPDTIGELIHLRYLSSDIFYILPETLSRLYHLQFIFLGKFSDTLQCWYKRTQNRIFLQCVNRHSNTKPASALMEKLIRLQQLKELAVRGQEDGYMIGELKDVNMLRDISIYNLENVSYENAYKAKLKDKKCLNTLYLQWNRFRVNNGSPEMDEKVLDGLEPHSNLKKLTICSYTGARSPYWMEASILSQLTHLYLRDCRGWVHLPPLGQLPFLKVLLFIGMNAITRIGPDLYGVGTDAVFPVLEELEFIEMPQLIEWSIEEDGRLYFPHLRILQVKRCYNLKVWPAALPPRLTKLDIEDAGLTTLPACLSLPPSSSSSSSTSIEGLLHLRIKNCRSLQALVTGTGQCPLFPSLQTLWLQHCGRLERSLAALLQGATSLQTLHLKSFAHMTSLPLGGLGALRELSISLCPKLKSLEGFQYLVSLEILFISGCHKLATTDTVPGFAPPLASLYIGYPSLQVLLPALSGVTSLKSLTINECVAPFPADVDRWLSQNSGSLQRLRYRR